MGATMSKGLCSRRLAVGGAVSALLACSSGCSSPSASTAEDTIIRCSDGIDNDDDGRADCDDTDCDDICVAPACGDGTCDAAETDCAADCGHVCGNSKCEPGETGPLCPADCPPQCGDGYCQLGETRATCLADCAPVCGDGYCAADEDAGCTQDCDGCNLDCEEDRIGACTWNCIPTHDFNCNDYCELQRGCGYIGVGLVWETVSECRSDCAARNSATCLVCIHTYGGSVARCDADCDPYGCRPLCDTSSYCGG